MTHASYAEGPKETATAARGTHPANRFASIQSAFLALFPCNSYDEAR